MMPCRVSARFLVNALASQSYKDHVKAAFAVPAAAMTVQCNWDKDCDSKRWVALAWDELTVCRSEGCGAFRKVIPTHRITKVKAHVSLAYMRCTVEDIPHVIRALEAKIASLAKGGSNVFFEGSGEATTCGVDTEDYSWIDLHVSCGLYNTCHILTALLSNMDKVSWRRPTFHASFETVEGTEIHILS